MKLIALKEKLKHKEIDKMLDSYVIYCRKSTEAEDRQVASIESQLHVLRELSQNKKLNVVKEFSESKSAKAPEVRPQFVKMMEMFAEEDRPKGIVCWKINRLSRNPQDEGLIRQYLYDGRLKEIVTPYRTYTSEDSDFNVAIEGAQSQRFIRDLARDTRRGLDEKNKKGIFPGLAPTGYINDTHLLQGQKTISPHPLYFKLVRRLFEMAMSKRFSTVDIWKEARRLRIKTNRGNTLLSRSQIHDLLRNPFYCGQYIYAGELHPGSHKPMLSVSEYDLVQEFMEQQSKPRNQTHTFPLSGMIRSRCGYMIVGETHKKKNGKIYDYYKCSQLGKGCQEPMISAKDLESQVYEFLGKIKLSDKFVKWATKWLKEMNNQAAESQNTFYKNLEAELKRITENKRSLTEKFIEEKIEYEDYKTLKNKYQMDIARLREQLKEKTDGSDILDDITVATFEFAKLAQDRWQNGTIEDKKGILTLIGSNLVLKNKQLHIEPKSTFLLIKKAYARSNSFSEADPRLTPKTLSLWGRLAIDVRTNLSPNSTEYNILKALLLTGKTNAQFLPLKYN